MRILSHPEAPGPHSLALIRGCVWLPGPVSCSRPAIGDSTDRATFPAKANAGRILRKTGSASSPDLLPRRVALRDVLRQPSALRPQQPAPGRPHSGLCDVSGRGSSGMTNRERLAYRVSLPERTLRAGLEMGQVQVRDYYREALGAIGGEGLAVYTRRVSRSNRAVAARHFDPGQTAHTERLLKRVWGPRVSGTA